MKSSTATELKKLVELIDVIQTLKMSMKVHIQTRMREQNFGITYEMFQVLVVLWKKDNINQQEIADRVQKNKASLTSLIDNLVKRKLVVRNEDPADRRNKIISLTKQGSKYSEMLQPMLEDFYTTFRADISVSQIESVTRMLHKLNKNLAK